MSLFDAEPFENFLRTLPAVEIVHQWGGASVGKVGGKIFAILSYWDDGQSRIGFKCSDLSFRLLPELDHVQPAKYLARAKWVQIGPGAPLSEDEIRSYIDAAHRIIAAKLTRAQKKSLGLEGLSG